MTLRHKLNWIRQWLGTLFLLWEIEPLTSFPFCTIHLVSKLKIAFPTHPLRVVMRVKDVEMFPSTHPSVFRVKWRVLVRQSTIKDKRKPPSSSVGTDEIPDATLELRCTGFSICKCWPHVNCFVLVCYRTNIMVKWHHGSRERPAVEKQSDHLLK